MSPSAADGAEKQPEAPRRRESRDNQEILQALGARAKLTVSQAGDADEREADAVADAVVGGDAVPQIRARGAGAAIHRQCLSCEEDARISRKADGTDGGGAASGTHASSVKRAIRASDGQPMPAGLRREYEHLFSNNLENVRLHTGPEAESAAGQLSAKAFTHGSDIFFNRGRFAPETREGRHLLAHELTHTLQAGATIRRFPDETMSRADATYSAMPPPEVLESSLLDTAHLEHDSSYNPCNVREGELTNYALLAEYRSAMRVISQGRDAPGYFDYRNLQRRLATERDRRVRLGHAWLATMPDGIPETLYRIVDQANGAYSVLAVAGVTASGAPEDVSSAPLMTNSQFESCLRAYNIARVRREEAMRRLADGTLPLGLVSGISTMPFGPRGIRGFPFEPLLNFTAPGGPIFPRLGGVGGDGVIVLDSWAQPFELGYGRTLMRRLATGGSVPLDYRVGFDIDEPLPVGDANVSMARRVDRALDPYNRQLLDWITNRRSKGLGIDPRDIARGRAPLPEVSLLDDPNAIFTRRFGEVTEMRQIFEEARARVDIRRLSPGQIKEQINAQIRRIIQNGETPSGVVAREALRAAGFESVPGVGFTALRPSMARAAGVEGLRGGLLSGGIAVAGSALYMLVDSADHPDWAAELGVTGGLATSAGALGSSVDSLITQTALRSIDTSLAETGMVSTMTPGMAAGLGRFGGGAVSAVFLEGISMGLLEQREHSGTEVTERTVRSAALGGASVWAGGAIGAAVGGPIGFIVGLGIGAAIYYAGENLVPGGREDWDAWEAGCSATPSTERWRAIGTAMAESQRDPTDNFLFACFDGSTPIAMADGTLRNIAALKRGDEILSFNEASGELESRRVETVHQARTDVLMRVRCADGQSFLVTPSHKLATPSGWRAVGELRIGEPMWSLCEYAVGNGGTQVSMGLTRVLSLEPCPPYGPVYDLSVEETHTYFAGGVLAHNKLP
jgi:uncharacterized protein DUF4157